MERCQIVTLFDRRKNFIIQHHRTSKFLAAMYDTVSHRINLIQRGNHTHLRIRQLFDHQLHCLRVVRHVYLTLDLLPACRLMYDRAAVNPNPLA